MDNNKKLFEGLLKADGIEPSNITESERMVFREMLDREKKRMKHLSSLTVGAVWIFALAMLGLCLYEKIFEALRIPFVVGCLVIMSAMLIVMIRYMPGHNRRLRESGRKISKLYYLVYGKNRGLILIGKKDGKRFIYWPRIIMIAAGLWLITSLAGAGVYYLLCQRWIYSSGPMFHIFYCTVISLSLVIFILRDGLKTPLDDLTEVKTKTKKTSSADISPNIWRIIMKSKITKITAAALIIIAVLIGINQFGGSVDLSTIAFAEISEAMKNVSWMHQISKGFERGINGKGEQWIGFEAKIFASKPAQGKPVFINIKEQKSYTYEPEINTIAINHMDNFPLNLYSPMTMLESMHKMIKEQGGKIVAKQTLYKGQKVQLQEISMSSVGQNNESHVIRLYIQPETKCLIAAQVKGTNANGDVIMDGEMDFSYPQTGPSSIYDLGVPRDAKIVSNLQTDK